VNAEPRYQTTMDALLHTAHLLWPAPAQSTPDGQVPHNHRVVRQFLLFPNRRQPRVALPVATAPVAAEALKKYSQGVPFRERMGRAAAAGLIRLPGVNAALTRLARDRLSVTMPGDHPGESLERHLADLLGDEVVIGVTIGTPRANRKPVLHVITPGGRTLAWAKVGTSDATRALVSGEAEALARVWAAGAPGERLRIPRVLHHGRWRGLELLVLEPMRPRSARWRRRETPIAAMGALAGHLGSSRRAFADTPAWVRTRAVAGALGDADQAARFERIVTRAEERFGASHLTVGAWHGDWTRWNMAWDGPQVLLWDFERFATGVPIGFDLAHYRLQSALRDGGERHAGQLVTSALPALPTGGIGPLAGSALDGNDPDAVLVGYLVELAGRYVLASEPVEGTPLRRRTAWLLDLLDQVVVGR
jgi:Phosphotransferase enzyme family